MDDFVWMTLPATGGTNRFPADSAEAWKARGWVESDAPAWSDPTRAHLADIEKPAAVPAPPAGPPPAATTPPAPKTRRPAGDSPDEETA